MSLRRRRFATGLAALAAVPAVRASGSTVEVAIVEYQFRPARLRIAPGTTVRWTNAEKRTTHSVRFAAEGVESERLFPGEQYERRFDTPGRFPYECGPHPEMQGEVEVTP